MPYAGLTKFLLVIGFLSLLHAAYSAAQRKQTNHFSISNKKSIDFLNESKKKSHISLKLFHSRSNVFARHRSRKNQHIPPLRRKYSLNN